MFDWLRNMFSSKIKEQSFFDYTNKSLNVKGISVAVPETILPVELKVGEFSSEKTPKSISEKLKQLDLVQLQIAKTINSTKDENKKEEMKSKYFQKLIEMFETFNNTNNDATSSFKKKVDLLDGKELNTFFVESNFDIYNLSNEDLEKPSQLIWPVVLQNRVTLIHKAQIETIRIMQHHNWTLKIIIADCGTPDIQLSKVEGFKNELISHLQKRNVTYEKISLLSEYFNPNENSGHILKNFTDISKILKFMVLHDFNLKHGTYSGKNKEKIKKSRTVLKFIQPLLTWAVVVFKANDYAKNNDNKKTSIIAGKDELIQWKYIFNKYSNIGGIFNSILEDKENNTIFQEDEPMLFHSESEVLSRIDKGNFAKWLFEAFVTLPTYPNKPKNFDFCKSCSKSENCKLCLFPTKEDDILPDFVDKQKFVQSIWEFIGPV